MRTKTKMFVSKSSIESVLIIFSIWLTVIELRANMSNFYVEKSISFHIVLALDPLIFITQEWNKYQCVRNFLLYNRAQAFAALSLTVFELQQIKASRVDVKIATKIPFLSTSTECWHMLTTLNLLSNDTIAEYGSFWFQWFLNGEDPSNGLRATR